MEINSRFAEVPRSTWPDRKDSKRVMDDMVKDKPEVHVQDLGATVRT